MHAVQVSGFLDPAGRDPARLLEAWPTLLAVAAAAVEAGVRVTVLQAASRTATLERRGVRFHFVGARPAGTARVVLPWRLVRRARALDPDVIHLHGLGFPLHARLLARHVPAPLLVQDHGDRLPARWRRPYHRWGLAGVGAAAFTAGDQARPFLDAGILPPDVCVHPVLESSSRFRPGDRRTAREATGVVGDPAVLWVGRLDPNKDPLTALDAAALAANALPDLRLWLVFTDAPLLDAVRRRVSRDPLLAGRVELLGPVPHERVETLCRAADLFLSASRTEGSGYALLEALACGAVPAVTDIPSFRHITAGRVGALAPPGDPEALARALLVAAEEARRPGARERVRDHFERNLSFRAVGRELRAAYEAVAVKGAEVAAA